MTKHIPARRAELERLIAAASRGRGYDPEYWEDRGHGIRMISPACERGCADCYLACAVFRGALDDMKRELAALPPSELDLADPATWGDWSEGGVQ